MGKEEVGSAKREEEKIMKQEEDNPKGSHRKEWGFVKRQENFGKREEANMKLEEQMVNVKPEEFNQTMATHIGKEDNRKHVWVKETELEQMALKSLVNLNSNKAI